MFYKKLLCTALLYSCDGNPLKIPVEGFYFTQFADLQRATYYG